MHRKYTVFLNLSVLEDALNKIIYSYKRQTKSEKWPHGMSYKIDIPALSYGHGFVVALAGAVPELVLILALFFIPESPRWLVQQYCYIDYCTRQDIHLYCLSFYIYMFTHKIRMGP